MLAAPQKGAYDKGKSSDLPAEVTTLSDNPETVCLFEGPAIAAYGFGDGHPFGPDRHGVFMQALDEAGLTGRLHRHGTRNATREELALFHDASYIDEVEWRSAEGSGYLDYGDTPATRGIYAAAAAVVGTSLAAADALMAGDCKRAFIPIAGLHHGARERAAGFCVFNDIGVVIEHLHRHHGLVRIAYVDIDAHHGDGVYYPFEDAGFLYFVDLHEDGRYLYPGTGKATEEGRGAGRGHMLNIPMPPGADDEAFLDAWNKAAEPFLLAAEPQFIILQCGADSLAGDPITHLAYSERAHAHAARRLAHLADELGHGRLLAMGGGGYHRPNLARAWTAVVAALLEHKIGG